MKTLKVTPILVDAEDPNNIYNLLLSSRDILHQCITGGEYRKVLNSGWKPKQIILVADQEIGIGDNYFCGITRTINKCTSIGTTKESKHLFFTHGEPYNRRFSRRLVAVQHVMSKELIRELVIEYNSNLMKSFDIEAEDRFGCCNKCGAYQYVSFLICNYHPNCGGEVVQKIGAKIKDGFIIVANTEMPLPQYPHNLLSNMQYYMEYCQAYGYVTPQEWLIEHKHYSDSQEPPVYTEKETLAYCLKALEMGFDLKNNPLPRLNDKSGKQYFMEWFDINKKK